MKSISRPYILIREFKRGDEIPRRDLLKQYAMSFAFDAFLSCLFREVFIQLTVLIAAVMFIFFGLPLLVCLSAVPFVIIFLYVSIYSTYFSKAIELGSDPITNCWIAEAYEPFQLAFSQNTHRDYDIFHEEQIVIDDLEVNRLRRTFVGAIMIDTHRSLPNAGWISHFAISPAHKFDTIAEPLINRVLKYGIDRDMSSVETATTECQCDYRELLLKMDFQIKQVYHRQVLGFNSLRIMKSQMGVDLVNWTDSKNK